MEVFVKKVGDLEESVAWCLSRLGYENIISEGDSVLIKPNFLTKPKAGVTTDLDLLNCIVKFIKKKTENVFIGESDSTGRSFNKLLKSIDLGCDVVNLSEDKTIVVEGRYSSYNLPEIALNSKIVNVPVLKTHSLTRLTLSLKNLFGLIQDKDKEVFHWGISRTLCDLYSIFKPSINLLDATYVMDMDGPVEGRVKKADFLMASNNALALDLAACSIVGIEPEKIEHLRQAKSYYPVTYEFLGDEIHLHDFCVPELKFSDKLGALLQNYPTTRKILKAPTVRKGALKIKSVIDKL